MTKKLIKELKKIQDELNVLFSLELAIFYNIQKERNYIMKQNKRIVTQNSLLRGFLKFKNLELDYLDFSKEYQDWDNIQTKKL